MRSRLEAGMAAWLDHHSFDWLYEPRAYGDEVGQYLATQFRVERVVGVAHPLVEPQTERGVAEGAVAHV